MKTMIVVPHLSFSQQSYQIIKGVNEFVKNSITEVSVCPINVSSKITHTNFAVMNPTEIDSFYNGVLIATTVDCVREILGASNNSRKVLYLFDIEWLNKAFDYEALINTLSNERLTVITRSKSHQLILKNLGVSTKIIEEFNLEKIWNSLE